jgi:alginate O-acetyltransferase complex protein AlgI
MIFSSIEFIIFFFIFIISIKLFSKSQRNVIILFSLLFYSFWNLYFVILILYFCLITFSSIKYKFRIKYSLILIILPLFYFKYSFFFFNFFDIQIFYSYVYKSEIPLAISFITFTAIAAVIDVKKKVFNRESIDFYNISEFILFFPQLIAGPILRLKELFPLLQNKLQINKNNIKLGLILFLIGFIKKIFIADNIGLIIDPIFLDPNFFQQKCYLEHLYYFLFRFILILADILIWQWVLQFLWG